MKMDKYSKIKFGEFIHFTWQTLASSGLGGNLKILSKSARVPKLGESAFHGPVPRQFLPFMRLDFPGNVNSSIQFCFYCIFKTLAVPSIRAKAFERGIFRRLFPQSADLCSPVKRMHLGMEWNEKLWGGVSRLHPLSTKYSPPLIDVLLCVVLLILWRKYSAVLSHCSSAKSLG